MVEMDVHQRALEQLPLRYTDLADWYYLLTAPGDYAEEAEFYMRTIAEFGGTAPQTLLELGAGGGANASHYKTGVRATLTDLSPRMLALSRTLNPECEHIQGDMRSLRLGRTFDAVFVHDAVCYMTTRDDLRAAIETAFVHCRPGGVALFAPDETRENFKLSTGCGGHDGDGRALRYLDWTTDPNPADETYLYEFVYMLHESGKPTRTIHEGHACGLFANADWLAVLEGVGFNATMVPFNHSELPPGTLDVFVGRRPRGN
jgi:SAM-dependent methyltransferase